MVDAVAVEVMVVEGMAVAAPEEEVGTPEEHSVREAEGMSAEGECGTSEEDAVSRMPAAISVEADAISAETHLEFTTETREGSLPDSTPETSPTGTISVPGTKGVSLVFQMRDHFGEPE